MPNNGVILKYRLRDNYIETKGYGEMMRKIGRNDPCPCGSGKKYKKCCGATHVSAYESTSQEESNLLEMSKEIAYKGKIGRLREAFCIKYNKRKSRRFEDIEKAAMKGTENSSEAISCKKGCYYCCTSYVEATMQECEAIVYYLYHNERVYSMFRQKYPGWRQKIKDRGDIFRTLGQFWLKDITLENREEIMDAYLEQNKSYNEQNIYCPFLDKGLCSIYEVRPYMCASYYTTTPPEWCNPLNPNKPKIIKALAVEVMHDRSFYYKRLTRSVVTFMPLAVYQILMGGFLYLSDVPGLENLPYEVMNDSEVAPIIRKYRAQ